MCHWQLCCSRCRPLGVQPVLFSTWAALQMVWILKSAVEPCIWSSERSPLIWSRPTSLSPPALSPEYQSQQFKQKKGVQFQNQFYRTVWNRSQLVPTNQRMPSVRRKRLHPFPGKKQWTDPHWPCTPNFGESSTMPVNTMLPEPRPMSKPLGKQYLQRLKVHFPMLHSWNSSQRKKTHSTMWLCQNTPSKQSFATTVCFGYTTPKCLKMLLHIWCDWWMMFSMHWVSWKRWQQIATCDKNVFTELITASVDDYNQHSSHGPVAHSQMADKHGLNWQLDKIWYNMIKYDTIWYNWNLMGMAILDLLQTGHGRSPIVPWFSRQQNRWHLVIFLCQFAFSFIWIKIIPFV